MARHGFCSLPSLLCAVWLRWCCWLSCVVVCAGEVNAVCCCCYCFWDAVGFLWSSLLEGYLHIYFGLFSLHRSSVNLGITTSSAKKLPHRVVTLKSIDKGEEEMVFQYRGYGSWICVCRSSLWSLCFWDDMMDDVLYFWGLLFCWKFLMWHLHPGWSSVWWQFIISLINCSPPDVTVSRLPVQFCLPVQFYCILCV